MIDTTCSGLLDSVSLDISDSSLTNIEGLQYFKHLRYFICSNNNIASLPKLPANLEWLYCDNNNLNSLPALPNSISQLYIENNSISTLPALPISLLGFNCYGNPLDSFPPLPLGIQYFYCGGFPIRSFPLLPSSITTFGCVEADLDSLPILPDSLTDFECFSNRLTYLPTLPPKLRGLSCDGNLLITFPTLPQTLSWLDCGYNNLTYIPALPHKMQLFDCNDNPELSCLPYLDTITTINFSNTAITCIPDTGVIWTSLPSLIGFPICGFGNECFVSGIIDNKATNNLKVYPNPVIDYLFTDYLLSEATLRIIDMTGRILFVPIDGNKIDVSAFTSGLYCLILQNKNGLMIAKFVKE
jgi:hypothetical protein